MRLGRVVKAVRDVRGGNGSGWFPGKVRSEHRQRLWRGSLGGWAGTIDRTALTRV